jgi:hypothetical protein
VIVSDLPSRLDEERPAPDLPGGPSLMATSERSVLRLVIAEYFPDVLVTHSFRPRWHIEAMLARDRLESEQVRVPCSKDVLRLQVFFLVLRVVVGHGSPFVKWAPTAERWTAERRTPTRALPSDVERALSCEQSELDGLVIGVAGLDGRP